MIWLKRSNSELSLVPCDAWQDWQDVTLHPLQRGRRKSACDSRPSSPAMARLERRPSQDSAASRTSEGSSHSVRGTFHDVAVSLQGDAFLNQDFSATMTPKFYTPRHGIRTLRSIGECPKILCYMLPDFGLELSPMTGTRADLCAPAHYSPRTEERTLASTVSWQTCPVDPIRIACAVCKPASST